MKRSKTFENPFLKNGKCEFWSEALLVSILTYYKNDDNLLSKDSLLKCDFYENGDHEFSREIKKCHSYSSTN